MHRCTGCWIGPDPLVTGNRYFLFTLDVARRGCGLRDTSKKITCVGGAVTIEQYSKKGCKTADKTAPYFGFWLGPNNFSTFPIPSSISVDGTVHKLINDTTKVTTGSRRVSTRPKIRTTTPSTIILDREFYEWKIKLNNFVLLGSCSLLCVLVRFFEMKNRAGGRDIHPGAKF